MRPIALVLCAGLLACSDPSSTDAGQPDATRDGARVDLLADGPQGDGPMDTAPAPDVAQDTMFDTPTAPDARPDTTAPPDGTTGDGASCVPEGGKFTDFNPQGKCCGSLVHVVDATSDGQGGCLVPKCPCYVCTNCGDGLCGKGENGCNCPTDCPKPCYAENESFQKWDSDLTGMCCAGLMPVKDCMPAGGSCACPSCPCYRCTFCGNGSCGPGESWCNCLQDCPKP